MKLRNFGLTTVSAILIALTGPLAAQAATAILYVSPASGPVAVGSIIPVQIRVNTGGDPVNAIQGNITYNASQLSYQNNDAVGSSFDLSANVSASNGKVDIARATGGGAPAVKGDLLFATVYFKALTTAGTASVAVASDSHVVRSTDSVDIIVGAKAASGPQPTPAPLPKAKAYTSLAAAQKAVADSATPAPSTTATVAPAAVGTNYTPVPANNGVTKFLAWNSPVAWGGVGLLAVIVAMAVYAQMKRRQLPPAPEAPQTVSASDMVASAPTHGTYDPNSGAINPEKVYPTQPPAPDTNSDQNEG